MEQWTQVPLLAKLLKLLVNEMQNCVEEVLVFSFQYFIEHISRAYPRPRMGRRTPVMKRRDGMMTVRTVRRKKVVVLLLLLI